MFTECKLPSAGFHKRWEIFWTADRLPISAERICYMHILIDMGGGGGRQSPVASKNSDQYSLSVSLGSFIKPCPQCFSQDLFDLGYSHPEPKISVVRVAKAGGKGFPLLSTFPARGAIRNAHDTSMPSRCTVASQFCYESTLVPVQGQHTRR
jgi:hypothetical protein